MKEAVKKTATKLASNSNREQISNLLHNMHDPEEKQRVAFSGREGYELVETSAIVYAQAEGAYTHVYLQDK